MEKTKKKKLLKGLIVTAVIILVVVCLRFIFFPVRGAPSVIFSTYGEFTKALDKEYIAPSDDLLPNVPTKFEITYKGSGGPGGEIRPIIFDARGLFPTPRLYMVYSSSKVGTMYMLSGRCFEKQTLEEEKAKFIPNETINGVAVDVTENHYEFFIGDIMYNISREENCEIMSMEQMRKIVENIISQSK